MCNIKWTYFVLFRVTDPAQTSWPRSNLGRKCFIQLTLPHSCSSLKEVSTGTQAGQEAGADAEAMEGYSLLACYPWLAQLAPNQQDMVPLTRGLPHLIANWENTPRLDLMEALAHLKLLFLRKLQPESSWQHETSQKRHLWKRSCFLPNYTFKRTVF